MVFWSISHLTGLNARKTENLVGLSERNSKLNLEAGHFLMYWVRKRVFKDGHDATARLKYFAIPAGSLLSKNWQVVELKNTIFFSFQVGWRCTRKRVNWVLAFLESLCGKWDDKVLYRREKRILLRWADTSTCTKGAC